MKLRVLASLTILLSLTGSPAWADEELRVEIELKAGGELSGTLVEFVDDVYRVRVGKKIRRLHVREIARIRFGAEDTEESPPEVAQPAAPTPEVEPEEQTDPPSPPGPVQRLEAPSEDDPGADPLAAAGQRVTGTISRGSLRSAFRQLSALCDPPLPFGIDGDVPREGLKADWVIDDQPVTEVVERLQREFGLKVNLFPGTWWFTPTGVFPISTRPLLPLGGEPEDAVSFVRLDLDGMSFEEISREFATELGVSLMATAPARKRLRQLPDGVQLYASRVPLTFAIELVAWSCDLTWKRTSSGSVVFRPRPEWDRLREQIRCEFPQLTPQAVMALPLKHGGIEYLSGGKMALAAQNTTLRAVHRAFEEALPLFRFEVSDDETTLRLEGVTPKSEESQAEAAEQEAETPPAPEAEASAGHDLSRLGQRYRTGDRLVVREIFAAGLHAGGDTGGWNADMSYRSRVRRASADGRLIRETITYQDYEDSRYPEADLAGLVVELEKRADDEAVVRAKGDHALPAELRNWLEAGIKYPYSPNPPLPVDPTQVEVGAKWNVSPEDWFSFSPLRDQDAEALSPEGATIVGELTRVTEDGWAVLEYRVRTRMMSVGGRPANLEARTHMIYQVPLRGGPEVKGRQDVEMEGEVLGVASRGFSKLSWEIRRERKRRSGNR